MESFGMPGHRDTLPPQPRSSVARSYLSSAEAEAAARNGDRQQRQQRELPQRQQRGQDRLRERERGREREREREEEESQRLRRERQREQEARQPSRLQNLRAGIQNLFTGASNVNSRQSTANNVGDDSGLQETPKTPQFSIGLRSISPTRLDIPHLRRSETPSLRAPSTRAPSLASPTSLHPTSTHVSTRRPSVPNLRTFIQSQTPSAPRSHAQPTDGSSPVQGAEPLASLPPVYLPSAAGAAPVGVDPEERQLAELAAQSRRRRHRQRHRRHGDSSRDLEAQAPKARKCFPKVTNNAVRSKLSTCAIAGTLLLFILAIYLAVAFTNEIQSQEFHILLILLILVATIFFCHSLIQLCIVVIKPPPNREDRPDMSAMLGPGGYADPPQPIRVALAYDEEVAGVESDATKMPPPAYGLWRESVRMDPNRLFWQRNPTAAAGPSEERPATANRPPSYVSEDGVNYVVEAVPRSIAPVQEEVELPLHPSEVGRVGRSHP